MPPAIPTASRAPAHTRTRAKKLLTTYGYQQLQRQRQPDSTKPGEVHRAHRRWLVHAAEEKRVFRTDRHEDRRVNEAAGLAAGEDQVAGARRVRGLFRYQAAPPPRL